MIFKNFNNDCMQDYKEIVDKSSFLTVFGSEYCYSVICALRDYQKLQCALFEGSLIIKGELEGKIFFAPPISIDEKSFVLAINNIILYCQKNNIEPDIKNLTQEMYNLLKEDIRFSFKEDRDLYEYLYNVQDLIELKGKKYHSKRNFINTFNSLYSYQFEGYKPEYLNIIDKLIVLWQDNKDNYSEYERHAILYTLENIEACGNVFCDVLFIDGNIAGFIVGAINKHLDVNIIYKKADINYKGIDAVLLNLFIKKHFSHCRYINMQEDMGLIGLRQYKLSYQPIMLLKKYNMSLKND